MQIMVARLAKLGSYPIMCVRVSKVAELEIPRKLCFNQIVIINNFPSLFISFKLYVYSSSIPYAAKKTLLAPTVVSSVRPALGLYGLSATETFRTRHLNEHTREVRPAVWAVLLATRSTKFVAIASGTNRVI